MKSMRFSSYNNLYVLLPQVASGGPELGHQLVDCLRTNGKNASIVYFNQDGIITNANVLEPYKKYNVVTANYIEDSSDNVLVLPETLFEYARKYTKIRIACWWMSVDKFIGSDLKRNPIKWYSDKSVFQNLRKNIHVFMWHLPFAKYDILGYLKREQNRVIHLYQSEYAHQYLKTNDLSHYYPLSDYINKDLIPTYAIDHRKKEDIILYNPTKGYEFTKQIIAALPDYEFVALSGFDRKQLNQQYDRAKLYIDFGNFPGKDRIPRECVLHDCCIITGKLGASAFFEDVPISDIYKFDTSNTDISSIISRIHDVISHYDDCVLEFSAYKNIVLSEQNQFYQEIKAIFM